MATRTSPPRATLDTIEGFLAQKRIAIVGISHDPKDFSSTLFDEFCRRGYDLVPVNPHLAEVKGRRCFARLQQIQPPVQAAILMTSPAVTETVVEDCAAADIRWVWMYRAAGAGAVSDRAVQFCREQGMHLVPGDCPLMFLTKSGVHRWHGWLRKLTGSYPRRSSSLVPFPRQS